MKKIILTLLLSISGLLCQAKQPAEQLPTFKGGNLQTFREWITAKVKTPKGPGGMAIVIFKVTADGEAVLEEIRNSPGDAYETELRRVFAICPKWEPGWQTDGETGEQVYKSIRFTIPIRFESR
ncbi:MAG: hypothetical protein K2J51_06685 [Alistipes sp.]|nr:hypothetical protein [Alistipes sp.]MDE6779133.1 hypothetical protein [Alistipes sp.]